MSFVAGNVEIAQFLLQNGAGFSSYTLMDHPAFSKQLLRLKLQETSTEGKEVCVLEKKGGQLYFSESVNVRLSNEIQLVIRIYIPHSFFFLLTLNINCKCVNGKMYVNMS